MCGIGVGAWHQVLQQVAEEEARGMEREAQLEAESLVRDRMVGLIEAGVDVQGVETPRPSGTDPRSLLLACVLTLCVTTCSAPLYLLRSTLLAIYSITH